MQYIFSFWRLGHEWGITPGKALSGSLAFLRPGHAGGSAPSCPCHYEQIPQATWLGPLRQPTVSWCLGPKICKSCSSWFHFPPPYQIDKGCRPQFFFKLFKKPLPPVVLNRLQFLDGLCKKRVIVWCNKIRCTSLVQTSFLWNFIFLLWINNVRHGCSQYHFWYQEKYTTTNTGWPFQWQLVLSSTRILFFQTTSPILRTMWMYFSILFSATLVFGDSTGHINHFDGGLLMFLGLSSRLVFFRPRPKRWPRLLQVAILALDPCKYGWASSQHLQSEPTPSYQKSTCPQFSKEWVLSR